MYTASICLNGGRFYSEPFPAKTAGTLCVENLRTLYKIAHTKGLVFDALRDRNAHNGAISKIHQSLLPSPVVDRAGSLPERIKVNLQCIKELAKLNLVDLADENSAPDSLKEAERLFAEISKLAERENSKSKRTNPLSIPRPLKLPGTHTGIELRYEVQRLKINDPVWDSFPKDDTGFLVVVDGLVDLEKSKPRFSSWLLKKLVFREFLVLLDDGDEEVLNERLKILRALWEKTDSKNHILLVDLDIQGLTFLQRALLEQKSKIALFLLSQDPESWKAPSGHGPLLAVKLARLHGFTEFLNNCKLTAEEEKEASKPLVLPNREQFFPPPKEKETDRPPGEVKPPSGKSRSPKGFNDD